MKYICLERKNLMKKLAAVFVIATLLLNALAPTLAYAATYLQGTEVSADTLIEDAYVAVTYYDSKNKQQLEKGWIDAIGETSFTIRNGLMGEKDDCLRQSLVTGYERRSNHDRANE